MASVRFCPSDFAWRSAASVSAVSPDCDTTTTSVAGSGTLVAVAVLAGDLDLRRQAGDAFQPVLGGEARVVARAAGEHQHVLRAAQDAAPRRAPNSAGETASMPSQRVGDRRAAARRSPSACSGGTGRAPPRTPSVLTVRSSRFACRSPASNDAVAVQPDLGDVALLEIGDAVGGAGERHARRRRGSSRSRRRRPPAGCRRARRPPVPGWLFATTAMA